MERDVLERLITDRALGGLSGDVEKLLEAYLAREPAHVRMVEETMQTVELARHAMRGPLPSSMPAFPVAGFAQIERWRRRVRQVGLVAGLAACVVLSFWIGRFSIVRQAATPSTIAVPTVKSDSTSSPPTMLARGTKTSEDSFWSYEGIRARAELSRSHTPPRSRQMLPNPFGLLRSGEPM
jgi:anti-sigma factor RsiW